MKSNEAARLLQWTNVYCLEEEEEEKRVGEEGFLYANTAEASDANRVSAAG